MSKTPAPLIIKHPKQNREWLAKLSEDVLDPDLPIIDAHHHFWNHADDVYLLDDYLADLKSGHNVVATVYVQGFWAYRDSGPEELRPVGEVEYAVSAAAKAKQLNARANVCAGIIGFAELTLGARVEPVLAALVAAGQGRLRGIRNITARNPHFLASITTPSAFGVMASPEFRAGFALLEKYNLSFDVWLYHPQISELADLARAFPNTPIILDHVGGPLGVGPYRGKREQVFAEWRSSLKELAACPNVYVKLGGFGVSLMGFDLHENVLPPSSGELANTWGRYVLATIETFGAKRCMFEGNFPVDKNAYSYPVVWNAFKRIVANVTPEEKRFLFHDTAAHVYRL